jgi:hypothetical protein
MGDFVIFAMRAKNLESLAKGETQKSWRMSMGLTSMREISKREKKVKKANSHHGGVRASLTCWGNYYYYYFCITSLL